MTVPAVDLNRDQILLGDLRNFRRLREIKNPSQDEVRLHAASVRKMLLDGMLLASAGTRRLPMKFRVADSLPFVRAARNNKLFYFQLMGVNIFNATFTGVSVREQSVRDDFEFNPEPGVDLKVDGFLKQGIAFANRELLTRYDIIVYVANKAGGVHYDPKPTEKMPENKLKALGWLRSVARMGVRDGTPTLEFNPPTTEEHANKFRYEPEFIDAVYLEFLACIQCIIDSPDVLALEAAIEQELRNPKT